MTDDTSIPIRVLGTTFHLSPRDVESAFAATEESEWLVRPGIEPFWHVVVEGQSKPVKAVFRNLPGIPPDFEFNKDAASRVFAKLGFEVINTQAIAQPHELCLLGTWRDVSEARVVDVRSSIADKGGWASWWSFPIREEFKRQLQNPFYLYVNAGGGRMPFRMRVEKFETVRGNEGMESPWPEVTDSENIGKVRAGPKNSHIFKTWLYVSDLESVRPPLTLDDFQPAPGVGRDALLNQSAFGYAYLKNGEQKAVAPTSLVATNRILYGPPGTGKTHWMRQKLEEYTDQPGAVDHETWLQELIAGYGWRTIIVAALADLQRPVRVPELRAHRWVETKAKQRGLKIGSVQATLWGYLQEHTPETVETVRVSVRRPPFIFSKRASGEWELLSDWKENDEESNELVRLLQSGPGGAQEPIRRYRVVTFHPSYSYEDFVRGIRPITTAEDGTTQFRVVDGIFKQICDEARANPVKRYALFIDEINRANIAKVFGELITLIEPDKRAVFDSEGRLMEGMAVQLPGGNGTDVAEPPFGVPANLDIFGTMNTADRSIALLDVALRRRFEFCEMEPNYDVIDRSVEGVHLGRLLKQINDRLEYLLDRDHRIGHAYFIRALSIVDLRSVFRVQVIPLLQEYFFDDLARVALVIATSASAPFVRRERLLRSSLFAGERIDGVPAERARYVITPGESWTTESFAGIYIGAEPAVEEEVEE
jgi:hypothetical protein